MSKQILFYANMDDSAAINVRTKASIIYPLKILSILHGGGEHEFNKISYAKILIP